MVNKFLLGEDKLMRPFTKNKEKIQKFMETGNAVYIHKNDFDKACFQHDMTYDKYKDLTKRTQSDKVLRDKAFKIMKTRGLVSMVYKFFDKKSEDSSVSTLVNRFVLNQLQIANELHRLFSRKFKRRRVYSSFKDSILGVDLADMQLVSNYNRY